METQDKISKILLLILVGSSLFGSPVDESIKKLSSWEKRHMKVFFNKAVKIDQAGHVLYYNTKPVTLIAIVLENKGKVIKEEIKAAKGWEAFKKHQHLFPHPNFIFTENSFKPDKDLSVLHIYMINRTSLEVCLKKHASLFQEILGPNFLSDEFISELEAGECLPDLIKHDELLTGLLLGYGEASSKAFKRKYSQEKPQNSEREFDNLQAIRTKKPNKCDFRPIVFAGNPHSEQVKQLKSTYEKELEEVWEIYRKSKKPLKLILEKICEDKN